MNDEEAERMKGSPEDRLRASFLGYERAGPHRAEDLLGIPLLLLLPDLLSLVITPFFVVSMYPIIGLAHEQVGMRWVHPWFCFLWLEFSILFL